MDEENKMEKLRTYHFSDKKPIMIECVIECENIEHGTHKITTSGRKEYIIKPGWYYIEIEYN